MARQAIGVEHPTEEQLRRFSAWTDDRIWLFDHVGRITPANALAVVNYAADELEIGHIVIDSMMMVCTSEEHLDEQKAFATDVVRTAIDTQTHIHVVAHCRKPPTQGGEDRPPTKYELRGSAAISDQMHNVVTVWSNKAKDRQEGAITTDCDAVLSVEKQRNGRYEGRIKAWFDKASMRLVDDGTSPIEPYAFMRTV
jgi:twinkle protein